MRLTKTKLKQLIKEAYEVLEDEPGHPGATEETQAPVEAVFNHLAAAEDALWELQDKIDEENFKFNLDSPIAMADLDSKVHAIKQLLDGMR